MFNKDTLQRKRRRMLNRPLKKILMKLQNQNLLMLLHQRKNRFKLLQVKLIGQRLTSNKLLNMLTNHFTHLSIWVTQKLWTPFQTTNHQPKKIRLKVDMLQFFLSLLQNKKLCMLSMKTSNTWINFTSTQKVSDYLCKIQVLEWVKLDNSTMVFSKWLTSIHLQLSFWKFLPKARDLYTSKVFQRDI